MFQFRAYMPIEIEHVVHRDGSLFLQSLLVFAQPNCWRHDGSIEPFIFGSVIIMPILRGIIFKVVHCEFSFSQI